MTYKKHQAGAACFIGERTDLIALACSIVGCSATAEDLVQESWIRWQGRAYPEESARPIFRRIVVNLARDWHRKEKRAQIRLRSLYPIAETALDSEHIVITRDDLARAIVALRELPDRTLTAFRMHRLENLTYQDIASHLGVSTPRAFQLVRQALVHIALRLDA